MKTYYARRQYNTMVRERVRRVGILVRRAFWGGGDEIGE